MYRGGECIYDDSQIIKDRSKIADICNEILSNLKGDFECGYAVSSRMTEDKLLNTVANTMNKDETSPEFKEAWHGFIDYVKKVAFSFFFFVYFFGVVFV